VSRPHAAQAIADHESAGMKKLVPPPVEDQEMHAGIRTANAMSPMTEVMNTPRGEGGARATCSVRRSRVVAMK